MNTQDKSKLSPGAADLINARAARRAGDWLGVYDVASKAMRAGRDSEEMRYNQALALANIEDIEGAIRCCQSNANSSLVGAGLAL